MTCIVGMVDEKGVTIGGPFKTIFFRKRLNDV